MKVFNETTAAAPIHFIGAGGIGMSGLMEVLHQAGFTVQGSDSAAGANVQRLQQQGITVYVGHAANQLGNAGRVVVSSAIQADNPELVAAQAAGLPVVHRAEMLAEIMRNYHCIAVAGTHGKTSTTGLVWAALKAAGADVGLINGGIMQGLGTNVQLPQTADGWLVVEADESDRSFLKLPHAVAVVLNVEPEHMENYHHDETLLYQDFTDFLSASTQPACNVVHGAVTLPTWDGTGLTYGRMVGVDVPCEAARVEGWQTLFEFPETGTVTVNLPGLHYAENTTAALAVVQALGFNVAQAAKGLATYGGVARRFTRVGTFYGATVVDDYGHHPTEIQATLAAARALTPGRLWAVVQPHRYSRLKDHMAAFATCTQEADATWVLPVHAAGEAPLAGITGEALAAKMVDGTYVPDFASLQAQLAEVAQAGDTILMLGAGTITTMARTLVEQEIAA